MKSVITAIVLSACLAACASNPPSGTELAQSESNDSGAKTERVCETVRTNQTGQRLKRVCRDVLVKEEGDQE